MNPKPPPLVVHIIYALGTGGLENGLVNIINRAPIEQYRHAIVCLTTADDFSRRLTVPGVQVITMNKKPGQDWGLFLRLWRVLRKLRPSIIHTRNLAALEMQLVGLMLPGVRRIHGEHGRDIYDLDGSNRKYRLLRRAMAPLIHRWVAVSEDLRNWLVEDVAIPSSKVVQIYNGVDSQRFRRRGDERTNKGPEGFLSSDSIVIGTVGRMAEVKDQRTLVTAFAELVNRLPEQRPRLRLVLVGDGPLHDKIDDQVRHLAIDDIVWLPGDRSDVPEMLAMMDIFVLPSLAEGISNTILEAMAVGLPVVATRTGGNPELVRDNENGYLVPVNAPTMLADKLQELVETPGQIKALGKEGRRSVDQRFVWANTVERYLSIYDEVLTA